MRAAIIALALTGCYASSWSKVDTARELTYTAESTADYMQSRAIVRLCDEQNSIVGLCGENMGLAPYMVTTMLVHAAVSVLLPPKYRAAWQYITIGVEGSTIVSNESAGYGVFGSDRTKATFTK